MVVAMLIVLALNSILLVIILLRGPQREFIRLEGRLESLEQHTERTHRFLQDALDKQRDGAEHHARTIREELAQNLGQFSQGFLSRFSEVAGLQKNQIDSFSRQLADLTQMNEQKLERMRDTVEKRLLVLQEDNSQKLEMMRETVNEKLHSTLERRLGESFKVVSERLEKVHQGLGEMQHLASGVGDLKRVLSNVKTRGMLGEIQLGNLLEQVLTPDQYDRNVITKRGSRDNVEFAIKLPGREHETVYLPIDAKFPTEDYERLQDAQEAADVQKIEEYGRALENRLKLEAKHIRDKYLDPPHTTDFGILFLPFEGIYAEVLRRPGFCDMLQRTFRVSIAGPTTIAALLNSLQLGFRTLAVEKRASEVWTLLGTVKTEFSKFGGILEKTHKKLQEASNTIESAARKSRNIERKLRNVQELPAGTDDTAALIEESL